MNPSNLLRALVLALSLGLASAAGAAPPLAEGAPLPRAADAAPSPAAGATAPPVAGFHFFHKDWEVVCDNTGTCRAAGYHEDNAEARVSVLVTRRPGPGTRPEVRLVLGSYSARASIKALPPRPVLGMVVNDRPLGTVRLGENTLSGTLSRAQANALLRALPEAQARISWDHGQSEWVLSDQGARAVLLKMDEAQGRLNTPGALVARGTRDERQVPGPRPAPVITVPPVPPTLDADRAWPSRQGPALLAALRATVTAGDLLCPFLTDQVPQEWEVRRLNARQLLVATPCWLAAYNFGSGVWVVNEQPPYAPVLVTDSASAILDSEVIATHKGRGLGDCYEHRAWVWDGTRFEPSSKRSSGMCRLIEAGGTWDLPTLVTRVRPR